MCRLMGWVSDTPRSLAELLPQAELAEFTELSRHHADGWGLAWLDGNGEIRTLRSLHAAHADGDYAEAVAAVASTAGLVHLRWATPGIPVREGNTHPFVHEGYAFAHNGSIWDRDDLLPLIDGEYDLAGDSDSELYLLALLERTRKHGTDEGLRSTIADLTAVAVPSSLNALLLGDGALTALCCNIGDDDCPGTTAPDTPAELLPGYYDLRLRRSEGATVVASSGWADDASWDRMDNGTAMVLTGDGRDPRVVDIGGYPARTAAEAARRRFTGDV